MQAVDDIGVAIADVYAKSLLSVAREAQAEASLLEELDDLVAYVNGTPEFAAFLTGLTVDPERRREVLERAMRAKVSDTLLNFLQVLNNKDRLPLLEQVARQYRLAYEAMLNEVEVTVTTAVPLPTVSREALVKALAAHTGKKVLLCERVDASLIGGMAIHIGDEKIDLSVSYRLACFRAALLARASHEIHTGRSYFTETE